MKIPVAYTKRTKREIGVSYDEYGMPYTEIVNEKGEIKSIFEEEPRKRVTLPIEINVKFLHETRLLRNSSLLPLLPFFQDLPKNYSVRKGKKVERIKVEKLIIGGGTSGLAALDNKSLLITRELFGDILFDTSSEILTKLKEKAKTYSERILYGNYLGKFDEGILIELEGSFILVNAEKIIVATGGRTLKPIFKGNWEPGVVSREFYLRRLKGEKGLILVLGFNDLAVKTALHAEKAVILAPKHVDFHFSPYYKEIVNEKGIELIKDYILEVVRKGERLVVNTESKSYEASLIVFSVLKQPRIEVSASLGAPYIYENHIYKPLRSENIYFTGGMLGIIDENLSYLSGENPEEEIKNEAYSFQGSPYYYGSNGLVCECEEVWLEDIKYAKSLGLSDTESVKRVTGLGTGKCQGKACVIQASDYLGSTTLISFRSPIYPVRL